jgi:hypothetical protein
MQFTVRGKWAIALMYDGPYWIGEPMESFEYDGHERACGVALFDTEKDAQHHIEKEKKNRKRTRLGNLSTAKVVPVTVTIEAKP